MELAPHLEKLRADLAAAAAVGGEQVATAARLLSDAVEPALRLVLLDLLTEAADDLSTQLGGAVVEVRLHGREPELVASAQVPLTPPAPPAAEEGDPGEGGSARVTLRLPESVKARCEQAAAAEGQSLNAWMFRALVAALDGPTGMPFPGAFAGGFPGVARAFVAGQFPPGFPFNDRPGRGGPGRRVTGFGQA
jgi:hypothetical protein